MYNVTTEDDSDFWKECFVEILAASGNPITSKRIAEVALLADRCVDALRLRSETL